MESDRKFLSLTEVGERLEVSIQTVARMIERGELPSVRIGRRRKIRPRDLESYVERGRTTHAR
jgi:putative molybdopterin biosynthesis protein